MTAVLVLWLAVGLFADVGVQVSPPFETEAQCLEAVAHASKLPEAVGISGCIRVEVPVKKEKT